MIKELLGPGVFIPNKFDESATGTSGGNQYRLNATGQVCGVIFRAPKAGTIVGADLHISVVSNAPDNGYRIGRQGITSGGLYDGTYVAYVDTGAGQPSAVGWLEPGDWDVPQVVTKNELVCIMITQLGFTTGDSVTIGAGVNTAGVAMPYGMGATASTKNSTYLPLIAPRYSDGTYACIDENMWLCSSMTNHPSITTTTTPDELAMAFTPPCTMRIKAIAVQATFAAGGDYDAVLYDAAGNVLASASQDPDIQESLNFRWVILPFAASVVVKAGQQYFAAIKPTTTTANSIRTYYATFPNVNLMDLTMGGRDWYMATRTDGGAWTHYNNGTNGYRKTRISVLVDGFDDGAVTPRTRSLRKV